MIVMMDVSNNNTDDDNSTSIKLSTNGNEINNGSKNSNSKS